MLCVSIDKILRLKGSLFSKFPSKELTDNGCKVAGWFVMKALKTNFHWKYIFWREQLFLKWTGTGIFSELESRCGSAHNPFQRTLRKFIIKFYANLVRLIWNIFHRFHDAWKMKRCFWFAGINDARLANFENLGQHNMYPWSRNAVSNSMDVFLPRTNSNVDSDLVSSMFSFFWHSYCAKLRVIIHVTVPSIIYMPFPIWQPELKEISGPILPWLKKAMDSAVFSTDHGREYESPYHSEPPVPFWDWGFILFFSQTCQWSLCTNGVDCRCSPPGHLGFLPSLVSLCYCSKSRIMR